MYSILERREKREAGIRAKTGKKSGAFSASASWFDLAPLRVLGGRRRHHTGTDYGCKEIDLLALLLVSSVPGVFLERREYTYIS